MTKWVFLEQNFCSLKNRFSMLLFPQQKPFLPCPLPQPFIKVFRTKVLSSTFLKMHLLTSSFLLPLIHSPSKLQANFTRSNHCIKTDPFVDTTSTYLLSTYEVANVLGGRQTVMIKTKT